MLLINFTGAPGSGKSTMAAGLFHRLKTRHWNCEIITEYTKELILTDDTWSLSDELLVFAEKYRRITRLRKVDLVITDSPLINSVVYGADQFGPSAPAFYEAVARSFDSLYFAVERTQDYIPLGRMPDADAADAAGRTIIGHLSRLGVPLWHVKGTDAALPQLVDVVEAQARQRGLAPLRDDDVAQAVDADPERVVRFPSTVLQAEES